MKKNHLSSVIPAGAFAIFALSIHWALAEDRVKPPKLDIRCFLVFFFEDARDHLEGSRPAGTDDSQKAKSNLEDSMSLRTGDKNYLWSNLIDSETMVSEIKRLNTSLTKLLSKPANFKGGGNLQCRRDFCCTCCFVWKDCRIRRGRSLEKLRTFAPNQVLANK